MDTERINAIRERLNRVSKGPWTACRMVHEDRGDDLTPAELGEYVQNSVVKSAGASGSNAFLFVSVEKTDGKSADVCHVGNGPTSPANADFIAHAPDDIAFLLASLSPVDPKPPAALRDNHTWVKELFDERAKELATLFRERDAQIARLEHDYNQLAGSTSKEVLTLRTERDAAQRDRDVFKTAFEELHATVQGECPALLDPDRGGSDVLWKLCAVALSKRTS